MGRLDLLALRVGAAGAPLTKDGARYLFSFDPLVSSVSVPEAAFARMAAAGLIDEFGAVTAAGRAAAREIIGGPRP